MVSLEETVISHALGYMLILKAYTRLLQAQAADRFRQRRLEFLLVALLPSQRVQVLHDYGPHVGCLWYRIRIPGLRMWGA